MARLTPPRPGAGGTAGVGDAGRWNDDRQPCLVPVPLHRLRECRRGFNQARELALHLSRRTGWPIEDRGLVRVRATVAQAALDREARRQNCLGAFRWPERRPPPRFPVLVDDVLTTGATVEACARVLKRSGARELGLWIAARAAPE